MGQSRTRDSAEAAGPSLPWAPWRAPTPLRQASWEATPSSSWWTATLPVDPRAATVASTSTESPTLARLALPPRRLPIHRHGWLLQGQLCVQDLGCRSRLWLPERQQEQRRPPVGFEHLPSVRDRRC